MVDKYKEIELDLGYSFKERAYLKMALTHRSAAVINNERLEYLGDSILSFVISDYLFERFSQATEGELTRLRASLVKGEMLTKISKSLGMSKYIILSAAENQTGGAQRPSILADALEAIIAAIYLDSDLGNCKQAIYRWYKDCFKTLSLETMTKDPKTQLQEYLQAKKMTLPIYQVINIQGQGHEQLFTVSCVLEQLNKKTQARGQSRRKAEQAAAQKMLEIL